MIKLYDFELSGHAHKVRLMLSLLDLAYERVEVNLAQGEQHQAEFLALNPFHHVPVLVDDGVIIRDSCAILCYLAQRYAPEWYPDDAVSVGRIQEWLAISTRELAEGPAQARLVTVFNAPINHEAAIARAHALLKIVEQHLKGRAWLAAEHASIADIAMYTYIAHAPEGGVDLRLYANIKAWLARIEALPGFTPMQATKAGLAI